MLAVFHSVRNIFRPFAHKKVTKQNGLGRDAHSPVVAVLDPRKLKKNNKQKRRTRTHHFVAAVGFDEAPAAADVGAGAQQGVRHLGLDVVEQAHPHGQLLAAQRRVLRLAALTARDLPSGAFQNPPSVNA